MMTTIKIGKYRYEQISASEVPGNVGFSSPKYEQGQTVEWSYGSPHSRAEGAPGDLYAREEDHSVPSVTFYRLVTR